MDLRRVGPYRLERQLGAGGMGVVYAAWDERLERRVALKQIRPDGAADPLRRERFRREARATARLDHPSIVRLHDLLETPEGDWLVLEYVAGTNLAERLRQGPLAPDEVAALARDVLGALEAAHAQGFLHRDLKAENVLLAPSGRAKVVDFGLAKLYDSPAAGGSPAATASGTGGRLVGTYRAMSPEQAHGLPLDPRSDLFSLGVLLYEAAAGVSPFQGETPVETLIRVCTHLQPPVRQRAAAVPAPLSDFIDALLEKDPERRPRDAGEALARLEVVAAGMAAVPERAAAAPAAPAARERDDEPTVSTTPYRGYRSSRPLALAAALLLLAAAGAVVTWRLRSPREPLYVAVARPEVGLGAGRDEVALASIALQAATQRCLAALEGVAALPSGAPRAGEAPLSPRELARALAADEVLTSSLDCRMRHCLAVLRRLRGADGRLVDLQSFEVPLDDLRLLDAAVAAYLRRAYGGFPARPDAARLQVRAEDYERFLLVLRTWQQRWPSDLEPLFAELGRIREGSPLFLDAYVLEARLAGRRFFETRDPADLDRALARLSQARALAPGDPAPLTALVGIAVPAGRVAEAEEALGELERLLPGDVSTVHQRALLAEQKGERGEALALLRAAAERHPSAKLLTDLANLEMRLGEIPAARGTLETLLERLPGHPGGEALLAQLELEAGSPERAAELYARLARRNPGFTELSNLGLAQLLLGRHGEAAASLRKAWELSPESAAAALNLADAEMLHGRRAEAEGLYRRALDLARRDPAPGFWQTLSIQAQALAHLGRAREAAAAIQRAVVAAPDNPQVAFEAALVYTVIGDTASALASAERARRSGYGRRWFTLPWFAPLLRDPGFRAWVEDAASDGR